MISASGGDGVDLCRVSELVCDETELVEQILSLDGKKILELGCGTAALTREIASRGSNREVIATEVDRIQHHKNLKIKDLSNVRFVAADSRDLPFETATIDVVFMFKSLHHVPIDGMLKALNEVARVLKPGGLAYISEPVFAGDFNDILCLFHNEQEVRERAFHAVVETVQACRLKLVKQLFFKTPRVFEDYADFERRVIHVTHNDHHLSQQVAKQVYDRFMSVVTDRGARFLIPIRVDLLQKPHQ